MTGPQPINGDWSVDASLGQLDLMDLKAHLVISK
jgi:hypothetical protein